MLNFAKFSNVRKFLWPDAILFNRRVPGDEFGKHFFSSRKWHKNQRWSIVPLISKPGKWPRWTFQYVLLRLDTSKAPLHVTQKVVLESWDCWRSHGEEERASERTGRARFLGQKKSWKKSLTRRAREQEKVQLRSGNYETKELWSFNCRSKELKKQFASSWKRRTQPSLHFCWPFSHLLQRIEFRMEVYWIDRSK